MNRWMTSRTVVRVVAVLAALLTGSLVLPKAFTVVRIEEQEEMERARAFDAAAYVDDNWEDVRSAIQEGAVDLTIILGAMEPDRNGSADKDQLVEVAEEHGQITAGQAHVYRVEASGTVAKVDTASRTGTMELQVDGYDGPIGVNVYFGPRIPSDDSSVRDAAGFIEFGDFREQTEYGEVGSEINARVADEVLSSLDPKGLVDRQVRVIGAFTIRTFNLGSIDVSKLYIVPVLIEVE